MHRRNFFPGIKSIFFHLLLLCTKFQSPRFNNECFFLLVGPLNALTCVLTNVLLVRIQPGMDYFVLSVVAVYGY